MGFFNNDSGKKVKERGLGTNETVEAAPVVVTPAPREEKKKSSISLVSVETKIKGTIVTSSMFQLEGELEGDIKGETLVHIGLTGKMTGKVEAKTVLIDGEVSGEIVADKVEIGKNGKAFATITSAIFVIQEGGVFEGNKKIKIALIKDEDVKPKKEIKIEHKKELKIEEKK